MVFTGRTEESNVAANISEGTMRQEVVFFCAFSPKLIVIQIIEDVLSLMGNSLKDY